MVTKRDEEDLLRERNRFLEAENRLAAVEERVRLLVASERKQSNELYAIKLTERIVFALVSLLLIATVSAIVAQALK